MVAESLIVNIISNIIYDVCKKSLLGIGWLTKKDKSNTMFEAIIDMVNNAVVSESDEYLRELSDSVAYYISTVQVKNIIVDYSLYKLSGETGYHLANLANKKKKEAESRRSPDKIVKSANDKLIRTERITEPMLVDYLSDNFINHRKKATTKSYPTNEVRDAFKTILHIIYTVLLSCLSPEDKIVTALINERIDTISNEINNNVFKIENLLTNILRKELKIPIRYEEKHELLLSQSNSKLVRFLSTAHIHMSEPYNFLSFYVPPILDIKDILSQESDIFIRSALVYKTLDEYRACISIFNNPLKYNEMWKYVFFRNNLIYITGGAGFGKSLFLQNIALQCKELSSFSDKEYLIILGDIKGFFNKDGTKKSMIEYLQECLVSRTLMDKNQEVTKDFIKYFLDAGRCFILLDALDEVEQSKREDLHKAIIAFFEGENPHNKICITSRDRSFIPVITEGCDVYKIMPLSGAQIREYVDNMVRNGRLSAPDRTEFIIQSSRLIDSNFLNSFLVLSLLVNIFKSIRELPENKVELYKKCFEYMAKQRENDKESIRKSFNWEIVDRFMRDGTFSELSVSGFPNNNDISQEDIVNSLCNTHLPAFSDKLELEFAVKEFLRFCTERTELFVPSNQGEYKYRFFHRSFFEYYYAKNIYNRIVNISDAYNELYRFDIDSEIFELIASMYKQEMPDKYNELIIYTINCVRKELNNEYKDFKALNILFSMFQIVNEHVFIRDIFAILLDYHDIIIRNVEKLVNADYFVDNRYVPIDVLEQFIKIYYLDITRDIIRSKINVRDYKFYTKYFLKTKKPEESIYNMLMSDEWDSPKFFFAIRLSRKEKQAAQPIIRSFKNYNDSEKRKFIMALID